MRAGVLFLLAGLGTCSQQENEAEVMAGGAGATTQGVAPESSSAISITGASQRCPPTGAWQACSVFERLDRAGLAPRVDSAPVTEDPLTIRGQRLQMNRGELEIYLYRDVATRQREEAKLDREKYIMPSAPLGMRPLPTLISSSNLLGILHSRNEHLRERVSDALTAGPPQPPASKP